MNTGTIESIYIAPKATAPTVSVSEVVAIPGVGLEGDRYALRQGTFFKPEPDFELTLIEAEAIEALMRDYNVDLAPGEARRNLVTRGIALNHLVGRDFQIGAVKAHGIRLCEPSITCNASPDANSSKDCATAADCGRRSSPRARFGSVTWSVHKV